VVATMGLHRRPCLSMSLTITTRTCTRVRCATCGIRIRHTTFFSAVVTHSRIFAMSQILPLSLQSLTASLAYTPWLDWPLPLSDIRATALLWQRDGWEALPARADSLHRMCGLERHCSAADAAYELIPGWWPTAFFGSDVEWMNFLLVMHDSEIDGAARFGHDCSVRRLPPDLYQDTTRVA